MLVSGGAIGLGYAPAATALCPNDARTAAGCIDCRIIYVVEIARAAPSDGVGPSQGSTGVVLVDCSRAREIMVAVSGVNAKVELVHGDRTVIGDGGRPKNRSIRCLQFLNRAVAYIDGHVAYAGGW